MVNTPADRSGGPVRVLIVDDHAVVRRGLSAYFDVLADVQVVGEAPDGKHALKLLGEMAPRGELPDVVLLDLVMPGLDGVAATGEISVTYPSVRVVVLTSFGEPERVRAALAGGAAGYLLKEAEPPEVIAAVRAAVAGDVYLHPSIARQLTRHVHAPSCTGPSTLTQREREVLVLVARGRSNQRIGTELQISERTARTHVSNVLRKLQLASRTQAALLAVREGLVPSQADQ